MSDEEEVEEPENTVEDDTVIGGENHGETIQSQKDVDTCMICMEEWTTEDSHRICSLRCGHFFGRSCIERWIKEKGSNAKCPQCNDSLKKVHIRNHYVKSITAKADDARVTALENSLRDLEKTRKTDNSLIFNLRLKVEYLEKDLTNSKKSLYEKNQKIAKLEEVIRKVQRKQRKTDNTTISDEDDYIVDLTNDIMDVQPRELRGVFHPAGKIESNSYTGYRLIGISPASKVMLVSCYSRQAPSIPGIFPRYGLKKYSLVDTNIQEFIPLHHRDINSLSMSQCGRYTLTAGKDMKVRITSITNEICIHDYVSTYEPVCVSWNCTREQQFYVVTTNRYAYLYDMRNTSEYIYQSHDRVASTRPTSIVSTNEPEGLLINDSHGSQFIEISQESNYDMEMIDQDQNHFVRYTLPFLGMMGSVDYDPAKHIALITKRGHPQKSTEIQHNLLKLQKVTNPETDQVEINCNEVQIFQGGKFCELLSHSKILRHPTLEDSVLVGAWNTDVNGIKLWDSSDSSEYQTIKPNMFIRDMATYTPENTNQHLLYAIGESGIAAYRWDYA